MLTLIIHAQPHTLVEPTLWTLSSHVGIHLAVAVVLAFGHGLCRLYDGAPEEA